MNKNVLITGCSSGIGFHTSLIFARNGYKVFATVRTLESEGVEKLKEIIKEEDLKIEIVQIDVNSDKSVVEGVRKILEKTKVIDILINNAGFGAIGPVEEFSVEEAKAQFETNFFGVMRMNNAVLPSMRKQKSGRIVNISSIQGVDVAPLYGIYAASKHALEAMSEALAFEVNPFGIEVVMIEPGSFQTNFRHSVKFPKVLEMRESVYSELINHFKHKYFESRSLNENKVVKDITRTKIVAKFVYKMATQNNPGFNNIVGKDAQMLFFTRKFVPRSIRNLIFSKYFKWGKEQLRIKNFKLQTTNY